MCTSGLIKKSVGIFYIKHSCGFETFFRPHQIEFAKRKGFFATLFDTLARYLVHVCVRVLGIVGRYASASL